MRLFWKVRRIGLSLLGSITIAALSCGINALPAESWDPEIERAVATSLASLAAFLTMVPTRSPAAEIESSSSRPIQALSLYGAFAFLVWMVSLLTVVASVTAQQGSVARLAASATLLAAAFGVLGMRLARTGGVLVGLVVFLVLMNGFAGLLRHAPGWLMEIPLWVIGSAAYSLAIIIVVVWPARSVKGMIWDER